MDKYSMKKRKFEVESQSESDFSPRESEKDKNQQVVLKQFMKSMKDHGEKVYCDKPPTITIDLIISSMYSIAWAVLFMYLSFNNLPTCKIISKTNFILAYFHTSFALIVLIYMIIAWWTASQKKMQAWRPLQRFIHAFRLLQIITELILLTVLIMNVVHFSNQCDNEFNLINSIYILLQSLLIGSMIFMLLLYSLGIATDTISKSLLKTYGSFSD